VYTTLKSVIIGCFLLLFCQFSWAQLNIYFPENQDKNVHTGIVKRVKLIAENPYDSICFFLVSQMSPNCTVYRSRYMVMAHQSIIIYIQYNPGQNPVAPAVSLKTQCCDSLGNTMAAEIEHTLPLIVLPNNKRPVTNISFNKQLHDFGALLEGPNYECTFTFTHNGIDSLNILNFHSSCGCLAVSYSNNPIPAGSSSDIILKYYTDKRFGFFHKHATISFSNGEVFNLSVVGEVVTKAQLEEFR
jgi:hypothetical protein